jgi:hypothetical protein
VATKERAVAMEKRYGCMILPETACSDVDENVGGMTEHVSDVIKESTSCAYSSVPYLVRTRW